MNKLLRKYKKYKVLLNESFRARRRSILLGLSAVLGILAVAGLFYFNPFSWPIPRFQLTDKLKITITDNKTILRPEIPKGRQTYQIIQRADVWPKIIQADIDPVDVHVGDIQTLSIIVESPAEIESVKAQIETDNDTIVLPLKLIGPASLSVISPIEYEVNSQKELVFLDEPTAYEKVAKSRLRDLLPAESSGIVYAETEPALLLYRESWKVRDTHNTTYHTTFVVRDVFGRENSVTLAWTDACGIPNGGDFTLNQNCTISSTDGIDNGNLTIAAGYTLTLNAPFVFNPGKTAIVNGVIAKGAGGQFRKTYLWMTDADADNYASNSTQYAQDTAPSGGRRRYLLVTAQIDCNDGNASVYPGVVTSTGSCGSCTYSSTCANSGSGTRTYDRCDTDGVIRTYSESCTCTRNTDGTSCGTTSYGACSSCSYSSVCATTGTGTQSVTTYTCSGGTCVSSTTSQSCTCTRSTDGTSCGTPTACGSCSYPDYCAQYGTGTRTVYTCSSGSCVASSQSCTCDRGSRDGLTCDLLWDCPTSTSQRANEYRCSSGVCSYYGSTTYPCPSNYRFCSGNDVYERRYTCSGGACIYTDYYISSCACGCSSGSCNTVYNCGRCSDTYACQYSSFNSCSSSCTNPFNVTYTANNSCTGLCPSDYYYCSGSYRVFRDYYCSSGSCTYSDSYYNCTNLNYSYRFCSGSNVYERRYTYTCSGGSCTGSYTDVYITSCACGCSGGSCNTVYNCGRCSDTYACRYATFNSCSSSCTSPFNVSYTINTGCSSLCGGKPCCSNGSCGPCQ